MSTDIPETGPGADGTAQLTETGWVLRFERRLGHPPDKVWRALTEPVEVERWLGVLKTDLAAGAPFELHMNPDAADVIVGMVSACTAPGEAADGVGLLEYGWTPTRWPAAGSATIRWEVAPEGDGTRLVLLQTSGATEFLAEGAAGWHGILNGLDRALAGGEAVPDADAEMTAWRRRRAAYAERFGVPPNPAIP